LPYRELFDFEILMDFGAFRDIARHRKGFQQQQRLTTEHGFVVPELFEEAGLAPRYTAVMQSVAAKKRQLRECFPHAASYVIPFAFLQRVRVQFDVRQMAYFCELRSAPEGHFSYREVAIRMGKILRERAPLYSRWIQVCEERVFLGRVESEQQLRRAPRLPRGPGPREGLRDLIDVGSGFGLKKRSLRRRRVGGIEVSSLATAWAISPARFGDEKFRDRP
jgi:hypothetical protein